jgi:hypothetical protein
VFGGVKQLQRKPMAFSERAYQLDLDRTEPEDLARQLENAVW